MRHWQPAMQWYEARFRGKANKQQQSDDGCNHGVDLVRICEQDRKVETSCLLCQPNNANQHDIGTTNAHDEIAFASDQCFLRARMDDQQIA